MNKINGNPFQFKSWVDGPRWMGLSGFIKRMAVTHGVELEQLERDKRVFYETVYYTAVGSYQNVDTFRLKVYAALKHFGATQEEA